MSQFQRGSHSLEVPMSLFKENRDNLCDRLRISCADKSVSSSSSWVFLMGGVEVPFNDTDITYTFRQESFFQWAFGVEEPDCFGAINVQSGQSILFLPRPTEEMSLWLGQPKSLDEYKLIYQLDLTHYIDQISDILDPNSTTLLTMNGKNSDSGLSTPKLNFPGIESFTVNDSILYHDICEW